jgi:hypothetical protein
MKLQKCYKCNEKATWMYMPGNVFEEDCYCNKHVPKGCTCNHESFYFGEGCYSKDKQVEEFLKYKLKIQNFGKKEQVIGRHLEEITDMEKIKEIFNTWSEDELLHLSIITLDENGEEYPCCEYSYYSDGIEAEENNDEYEKYEEYENY